VLLVEGVDIEGLCVGGRKALVLVDFLLLFAFFFFFVGLGFELRPSQSRHSIT
jgi:hypothetical protein